jgi:antibiotic biosynthesis monooxygenase (ABM) superfamily enzyme
MSIHVAITRRVRSGCEEEFQRELREFFRSSFAHAGVQGASMLVPPPGSGSTEFGILRTFAGEAERDAFYASTAFLAWEERIEHLIEGEPEYRELTGLEAWFRSPGGPPPRWKMAVATFLGVFPVVTILALTVGPLLASLHFLARNAVFNACVVLLLTWVVMPLITRLLHGWLHPKPPTKDPQP